LKAESKESTITASSGSKGLHRRVPNSLKMSKIQMTGTREAILSVKKLLKGKGRILSGKIKRFRRLTRAGGPDKKGC